MTFLAYANVSVSTAISDLFESPSHNIHHTKQQNLPTALLLGRVVGITFSKRRSEASLALCRPKLAKQSEEKWLPNPYKENKINPQDLHCRVSRCWDAKKKKKDFLVGFGNWTLTVLPYNFLHFHTLLNENGEHEAWAWLRVQGVRLLTSAEA